MKKVLKSFLVIFMFVFLINNVNALSIDKYSDAYLNVLAAEAVDDGAGGSKKNGNVELSTEEKTCAELLGKNMTSLIHAGITIFQIVAAIIALLRGMTLLIPAVIAKDSNSIKAAESQLIVLGIVLAVAIIFKPLVRLLGNLLEWDISCIM